jgi:hypothetical protein
VEIDPTYRGKTPSKWKERRNNGKDVKGEATSEVPRETRKHWARYVTKAPAIDITSTIQLNPKILHM